jgi:8-amino-7-oxononanoate synthase
MFSMNDSPIYERLDAEMGEKKKGNLFRRLGASGKDIRIDLSTNSYLALHDHPEVAEEARKLTDGCFSGNLASRIIETRSPLYQTLESELAGWKKTESALIFNSGYAANLGILPSLCTRDTEVFCDRLNHASIIDGIKLSGAILSRYAHCDMGDLRARLGASKKREKLIVTDTVFSMDGDTAPLAGICALAKQHQCMVMVDEAHAMGVFGKTLSGFAEECGAADDCDVVMGTLSKAAAGLGGFFAGSVSLRDCFINKARSLIYSTALPQSVLAQDLAAVRYIRAHPEMGKALLAKSQVFREGIKALGFDTLNSTTQIVPCIVKNDKDALDLSVFLLQRGIKAPAIRPPTVPAGTARIRFSIHSGCSPDDLAYVTASLKEWKKSRE